MMITATGIIIMILGLTRSGFEPPYLEGPAGSCINRD